ncbi:hypothetical protein MOR12E_25455 [Methylobacterium oryzae]
MRVVFMGTPDFAVPTLARLAQDGHDIAAVYTRAPARAGRGMSLRPSPVHALADTLGAPVVPPGDPAALAAALTEALSLGASARDALGRRSRAHVEAHFSLERMVGDTLAVYAELLGRST